MSDLSVRKMIDKVLQDALEAPAGQPVAPGTYPVHWPNRPFHPEARCADMDPKCYLRPTYHPVDERARTMGPNPRVQKDGHYDVGVFLEAGLGEDLIDLTAKAVLDLFPYGSQFTRDGLTIEVTRLNRGQGVEIDGWYYIPCSIYWTLWRAT